MRHVRGGQVWHTAIALASANSAALMLISGVEQAKSPVRTRCWALHDRHDEHDAEF
jgi:hypothetical protein